jgi:hypothetical protein
VVIVAGEVTTSGYVDIPAVVREAIRSIGYVDASMGFDCETCGVMVTLGAMAGMAPHTRPLGVVASSTNPQLAERLGLNRPSYQGPTGLIGVLHNALDRAGIVHQDPALRQAAGQAFYNTSRFTLRDLRARDETIRTLRDQVDKFERELAQTREQLVSEVQKLSAITSGELQLRPSQELAEMDADSLLTYARDVAEDLDVRHKTLEEGLEGIDTIKGSFDESRRLYEEQQQELQEQLARLRAEMDEFEQQQQQEQELDKGCY